MKNTLGNTANGFKYLLVNDRDKKYGLYVNTVGCQSVHPNVNYPFKEQGNKTVDASDPRSATKPSLP